MIKVKEVSQKEIYWLFPNMNIGAQANARVMQMLGELHTSFAPCSIAASHYVWKSEEDGWTPLSLASSAVERSMVLTAQTNLYAKVLEKAPNMAEKLMTIPNDEYIFYKIREDGTVALLYTAWGFRNFKADITPHFSSHNIEAKETLRISFARNGELLPNRNFEVVLPIKNNAFKTDENGVCDFGAFFKAGDTIDIVDIETGKMFNVVVTPGKADYVLDISQECFVTVCVHKNGVPEAGKEVSIKYASQEMRLTTDATGRCRGKLIHIPSSMCVARVDDSIQQQELSADGGEFVFNFSEPIAPEPVAPEEQFTTPHILVVDLANNVVPDYPIVVESEMGEATQLSNKEGQIPLAPMRVGSYFVAKDGYNKQHAFTYCVQDGSEEYIFQLPYHWCANEGEITVRALDINNRPFAGSYIVFSQDDRQIMQRLDDKGETHFRREEFKYNYPLTAKINSTIKEIFPIFFELEEGENEYELKEVMGPRSWWEILLEVLFVIALLIALFVGGFYFVDWLS